MLHKSNLKPYFYPLFLILYVSSVVVSFESCKKKENAIIITPGTTPATTFKTDVSF
jgi:hypothetical protein